MRPLAVPPSSSPPVALRTLRPLDQPGPDTLGDDEHDESALLDDSLFDEGEDEDEDEDHARQVSAWKTLPWWRRPSPYWIIFGAPVTSIGYAALLAPKVALYTSLACHVHRPEYFLSSDSANSLMTTSALSVPGAHVVSHPALNPIPMRFPNTSYMAAVGLTQSDPDTEPLCASDPVVQATVAKLSAVFVATTGILTCLTTGWWSALSDRYGRRIVICATACGLFVTDLSHVIAAWFADVLPGGYWFPLLGFFIEGLCGGVLTGSAVSHTYLADTTDPSTRTRYFSLSHGVSFAGVAFGPFLAGLLIGSTGTIMSVFFFVLFLHGIYIIFILSILPESLTRARARGARIRQSREKASQVSNNRVLSVFRSYTRFLTPLLVLLPEPPLDGNPLKRRRRNWNLTIIAVAYALVTSDIGSIPYRFQYVAAQFHWTPETTSYFVSCVGATRALFLAFILPFLIQYLRPAPVQLPSTQDEPARGTVPGSNAIHASGQRVPASQSSSVFDLALARASLSLDFVLSVMVVFASTGTLYTVVYTVGAFGAGFIPAVDALALDFYAARSENKGGAGRLFGALSVTRAIASQIISPSLYGYIYSNTVAVFPQAILVASLCSIFLALVCLWLVSIPLSPVGDLGIPGDGNEGDQTHGVP